MFTSPCSGFLHERLFGLFYRESRTGHGCDGWFSIIFVLSMEVKNREWNINWIAAVFKERNGTKHAIAEIVTNLLRMLAVKQNNPK